jgi:uncharacterized RDD family membrane protein YckC
VYRVAPAELESPRSCHQILGVTRGASEEDLRLAFLQTAFACHPANPLVQGDPAAARKRLREAAGAWAVLAGRPILGGGGEADTQAIRAFDEALAVRALELARTGLDADAILGALFDQGCPSAVGGPAAERAVAQAALVPRLRPAAREAIPSQSAGAGAGTSRAGAGRTDGAAGERLSATASEPRPEADYDDEAEPPPDANLAQRVAATVVDVLLVFVVCAAPIMMLGRGLDASPAVVERITLAAMLVGGALYSICSELGWGGTPGKRLLGMRVETMRGQAPDRQTVLLRHGLRTMSWCLFGLGFLIAPFNERRQALHDLLTETRVLAVSPPRPELVQALCAAPVAVAALAFALVHVGG